MSPFDRDSVSDIIVSDKFGTNAGNMIYANGVYRTLLTEDTEILLDHYKAERGSYTNSEIDWINENCSAYIVALADAFRESFQQQLNGFSDFMSRLKIPVHIVGVGLSAPYEPDFSDPFPFDEDVKRFVSTALEKTACLGLRGQITADYLKRLGFTEGRDYTAIGCPSVYTFGKHLSSKPLTLDDDTRISINYGHTCPPEAISFLNALVEGKANCQFVGQRLKELLTLYIGMEKEEGVESPGYPIGLSDPLYAQNQIRFFVNAESWLENLKHMDLSIGSRIHGNIAAVLSGTSAVFLPLDSRTREVCEYHRFPFLPAASISAEDRLEDVLASLDMDSHIKAHAANFAHFLDFLNQNGIDHIYKEDPERQDAPLDQALASLDKDLSLRGVESIVCCDDATKANRALELYQKNELRDAKKLNWLKKEYAQRSQVIDTLKTENAALKNENEKSLQRVNALTEENAGLQSENEKKAQAVSALEKENGKLKEENKKRERTVNSLKKENAALKGSYSYRIGRLITWPYRKLRSLLKKWKAAI